MTPTRGPTVLRGRRTLATLVVALTGVTVLAQVGPGSTDLSAAATQVTVAPSADARVLAASPTTNYGSSSRLDVDSPGEQSHLRFEVDGVSGTVQRATLRLFVRNGSSNAPSIRRTGAAWSEATITWDTRPPPTSDVIADLGAVTAGTWAEYDLTGQVTGDGSYDLVLLPDSTDGVEFDAREGGSPPQLVLLLGDGGSMNAPPVAVDDTASTVIDTAVVIDVAANDHDPDGVLDLGSTTTACVACAPPAHGALVDEGDGTFRYTPEPSFAGTDGFTYEICDTLGACDTARVTVTTAAPGTGSEVFVGAGDIANCSRSTDEATARLLDVLPGTVFTIGDNAYPDGSAADFANCYAPTWGRHRGRTHPTVGDDDYDTPGAAGYFGYFGAAAGDPTRGYYSYDLGAWHVIHLNSECGRVGGCRSSSPEAQWLRADLAANPRACILALHHEPLFSSKGGDSDLRVFWEPLYAAGADVVLSGHRHNYERFTRQTPTGTADPERGIRQFVVGTGGTSLSSFGATVAANSQVRNDRTHGVLELTLRPDGYDWRFVPIAGQSFTDAGSTACT